MKLGFIGAGKVGTTLAKYLAPHHAIIGFTSRSYKSAKEAADFTGSRAFEHFEELIPLCDTVFITVPDGQIKPVWNEILASDIDLQDKNIAHCSGALSSDVFAGREERGAFGYSVHPLSRYLLRPKPIKSSISHSLRSKVIRNTLWKWSLSSPMKATWFK